MCCTRPIVRMCRTSRLWPKKKKKAVEIMFYRIASAWVVCAKFRSSWQLSDRPLTQRPKNSRRPRRGVSPRQSPRRAFPVALVWSPLEMNTTTRLYTAWRAKSKTPISSTGRSDQHYAYLRSRVTFSQPKLIARGENNTTFDWTQYALFTPLLFRVRCS